VTGTVCAMPERGDPSEGPEYGWLYGKKGQQRSGSDDPEPTRMLPRMDRPGGRPGEQSGERRHAGTEAPPRRTPRETPPPVRKPRRRRPVGKIILIALVAWLTFLVAVPIWAWSQIDKVDIEPAGARPDEQPGRTFLLVGSDSRKGLSKEERRRLHTGGDVGQRTDTIMLLHTGDGPDMLLSIPRDSLVDIPGNGTTKINAAFAIGGPKLLVRTIEQNTGLRIDDYVEIGFGGFVNAVEAVGGVEICPKRRMVDKDANLDIRKGCQEVDGVVALGYARSRKVSPYGDIDRARQQREVVSAIGSEVKSPWTFINPVRYFNLNKAATTSIRISEGTGPFALASFGLAMTRVDGKSGLTCGMPIADQAVHWDRERALALLKHVKEDRTADLPKRLCTPTGLPNVG
jgi:LCP family protein required for cell wall assembly